MKVSRGKLAILSLISLSLTACNSSHAQHDGNARKITVATVRSKAVTFTERYVCRIKSHRDTDVRAPEPGILEAIPVREGQAVKQNDLLFRLRPTLAQQDAKNRHKAVSITAPFDGLVGRLSSPQESLVQKGQKLTTLFDNSHMWVYFNVPEGRFPKDKVAIPDEHKDDFKIELVLVNGHKFNQPGKLGAIPSGSDSKPGVTEFRADFPNPDRLLRDGQTGTVLIVWVQNDAVAIPKRATFQLHDKRYVWVVGKDDVAHRREIIVQNESDDFFVIKDGLAVDEKIIVDGIRQIRDNDKVK